MVLGRLTHYAFDAVLFSAFLAGMKRSTGLTRTKLAATIRRSQNGLRSTSVLGSGFWIRALLWRAPAAGLSGRGRGKMRQEQNRPGVSEDSPSTDCLCSGTRIELFRWRSVCVPFIQRLAFRRFAGAVRASHGSRVSWVGVSGRILMLEASLLWVLNINSLSSNARDPVGQTLLFSSPCD
ncbi:hypothetical protein B0T25DRAFT_281197 [Lasiosphaeria hispida]|uniref:DUF1748-domain-containing protein n=1 Tax=Lasiosphaeria hispida TaxID=260671 RepID=A0AAJ0MAU6_9PEZI|nr:hypothetical protein B0T25DRAFT_281197 [Lasiosphaeria hispida]